MSQKLVEQKKRAKVYDYDYQLERVCKLIKKDLSEENVKLIERYDIEMVNAALATATRHKNLKMILSLSRLVNKNWMDVTKEDVKDLVYKVMKKYSGESGKETNTTWDHKKVLKIFFRWVKRGSRDKNEVGDPPETKGVKVRRVKDKIVRENLLTDEDITSSIQYMIKENIMVIPDLPEPVEGGGEQVPDWVRNNAGWWADGLISSDDFVSGIKYLVEQGIIRV